MAERTNARISGNWLLRYAWACRCAREHEQGLAGTNLAQRGQLIGTYRSHIAHSLSDPPKSGAPRERRLQSGERERLQAAYAQCRNPYVRFPVPSCYLREGAHCAWFETKEAAN